MRVLREKANVLWMVIEYVKQINYKWDIYTHSLGVGKGRASKTRSHFDICFGLEKISQGGEFLSSLLYLLPRGVQWAKKPTKLFVTECHRLSKVGI